MKKTALILTFLVCFISLSCQGLKGSDKFKNTPKSEVNNNSTVEGDIKRINEEIDKINEILKNIKDNQVAVNQGDNSADKSSSQITEDKNSDINNSSINSSKSIIGTGSLAPKNVIAYARKKNNALNSNDEAIINKYFEEAKDEGVNVDIAIAQMLYNTNYLKQHKSNHNYGGLKDCRFPNMTIGVRAHIQHLLAYAKQTPKKTTVDPRFEIAFQRGISGIKFEQVYSIWSDYPDYGQKIEEILRNLVQ